MSTRTIRDLSKLKAHVYLHFSSHEVGEQFLKDAEAEGLTFIDGTKPTTHKADDLIHVSMQAKLYHVGWAGHIAYHSGVRMATGEPILRVDYGRYKAGEQEYLLKAPGGSYDDDDGTGGLGLEEEEKGLITKKFPSGKVQRMCVRWKEGKGPAKYLGFEFFESGSLRFAGILQDGGLFRGKEYYPSGELKFEGRFNDLDADEDWDDDEDDEEYEEDYFGPPHPVEGKFYSKRGELLYDGRFHVTHEGPMGYPKVVLPKGYVKIV